jgi:hypothetical protein
MKSAFVRIMLVLLFLALVANVVVTAVRGDSFITRKMVMFFAFVALVVANLSISGAAVYFTTKAREKSERSALKWSRRGFVVNIVLAAVLGAGPWLFFPGAKSLEPVLLDCAVLLLGLGVSNGVFALSAYRDYLRAVGAASGGGDPRRKRKAVKRMRSVAADSAEATWEE